MADLICAIIERANGSQNFVCDLAIFFLKIDNFTAFEKGAK